MTKLAAIEVGDCFLDLLLRVHDERAVLHDRLINRFAAQDEELRLGPGLDRNALADVLEHDEVVDARLRRAVDRDLTLHHEQRRVVWRRE